ncbi:unnamed protein product [Protopolystoma xenopodis]|uniref:Uncharacterized protein n=1 Tax=Protopolystoma xenopodis TaxID=117903 RepID=A0A3S5A6X3_9PLAT|nr:unnamed protein product [Protopolystoma xenopodis]
MEQDQQKEDAWIKDLPLTGGKGIAMKKVGGSEVVASECCPLQINHYNFGGLEVKELGRRISKPSQKFGVLAKIY